MKAFSVEPAACASRPGSCAGTTQLRLGVQVASGFVARAWGLLGRPEPSPGCGLLLPEVRTVHAFGMRHPLDLVFLDGSGTIVDCATLAPAAVAWCRHARHVLEMRSGETRRLGLRRNMRPRLILVDDIFSDQALALGVEAEDRPDGLGQEARLKVGRGLVGSLLGAILLASMPAPALARPGMLVEAGMPVEAGMLVESGGPEGLAGPDSSVAKGSAWPAPPMDGHVPEGLRGTVLGPLKLVRPVSAQTLQQLEEEAETLYRRATSPGSDSAELVRRYQSLAELSVRRSPHAWLRIGNIHQRAGSVGAAIDAYRKVRSSALAAAAETAAERKALFNLAALTLEQARQSLIRLAELPDAKAVPETRSRDSGMAPATTPRERTAGEDTGTPADAVLLQRHMESLQQHLLGQQQRQSPLIASEDTAPAVPRSPHVIERYTASGRRNAVKAAKGSLHVNPADELPAAPVPRPRARAASPLLPRVEYLLGDPLRSQKGGEGAAAADNSPAGAKARPKARRPPPSSAPGGGLRRDAAGAVAGSGADPAAGFGRSR